MISTLSAAARSQVYEPLQAFTVRGSSIRLEESTDSGGSNSILERSMAQDVSTAIQSHIPVGFDWDLLYAPPGIDPIGWAEFDTHADVMAECSPGFSLQIHDASSDMSRAWTDFHSGSNLGDGSARGSN